MLENILRRLGYIPVDAATAALRKAWAEADEEKCRRVQEERRFDEEYAASPDGLADVLDQLSGSIPVRLARHS